MDARSRVAREDQDRAETEDRITEVKDALAETTVADREMAAEEERMTLYLHPVSYTHLTLPTIA